MKKEPKGKRKDACLPLVRLTPNEKVGEAIEVEYQVEALVGQRLRFRTLYIIMLWANFIS